MNSMWCMVGTSLCLKSEVWAAWWQGMGTVAAILLAIGIASRQADVQRRARVEEDLDAKRGAGGMGALFGANLSRCLGELQAACEAADRARIRRERAALNDMAGWLAQIRIDLLPIDAGITFLGLRGICVRGQSAADFAVREGVSLGGLVQEFKALSSSAYEGYRGFLAAVGDLAPAGSPATALVAGPVPAAQLQA